MTTAEISPTHEGHAPVWSYSARGVEIRFTGRGAADSLDGARQQAGVPGPCASARQIHSARVLEAREGSCGEGDALVTDRRGLALAITVADCVPVTVWGGGRLASIHAGWRGIADGVVSAALHALEVPAGDLEAWIGPAIGACCYEVGEDVAERVAAASSRETIVRHEGGRLTLDLRAAVETQLRNAGVAKAETLALCTGCESEALWSFRRHGAAAGRNHAFAWLPE